MQVKVKKHKHQRMKKPINFDQQAAKKEATREEGGGAAGQKDFQRMADRMVWMK